MVNTHMMRRCLVVLVILSVVPLGWAGTLTPPGGPVAPTPGPEARIAINATTCPGDADGIYRITLPGSYYLTDNITLPTGKSGIKILASRVTVDLNGFGINGAGGSLKGVTAGTPASPVSQIVVLNGTITSASGDGVDLVNASHARVQGVSVRGCGGMGIVASADALISDCSALANWGNNIQAGGGSIVSRCIASTSTTGSGIIVSDRGRVESCVASFNKLNGIKLGGPSNVADCEASGNAGDNIVIDFGNVTGCTAVGSGTGSGIVATNFDAQIERCNALSNTQYGIKVGDRSAVRGCTAASNTLDNITLGAWSQAIDCNTNASASGSGIVLTSVGATARGCAAHGNAISGIRSLGRGSVIACTASQNVNSGVYMTSFGLVEDCVISNTTGDGIVVEGSGGVSIRRNSVFDAGAGSAGIKIKTGVGNLIEGNTLSTCSTGISVTSGGNTVSGNSVQFCPSGIVASASGNTIVRNAVTSYTTSYSINVTNCFCGPIINSAAAATTTNPQANIAN